MNGQRKKAVPYVKPEKLNGTTLYLLQTYHSRNRKNDYLNNNLNQYKPIIYGVLKKFQP